MHLCAETTRRAGSRVVHGSVAQSFHLSQRPVRVGPARIRFPAIGASFGQYPPVGMVSRSIGSS